MTPTYRSSGRNNWQSKPPESEAARHQTYGKVQPMDDELTPFGFIKSLAAVTFCVVAVGLFLGLALP